MDPSPFYVPFLYLSIEMIAFFGFTFTLVLFLWIIIASLVEAKAMEMLEDFIY